LPPWARAIRSNHASPPALRSRRTPPKHAPPAERFAPPATKAENLYDYAAQDPIDNYDLTGTVYLQPGQPKIGGMSAIIPIEFILDGHETGYITYRTYLNGDLLNRSIAPIPVDRHQTDEIIYVPIAGPGNYRVDITIR
jgi:hypothetical protein